MRLAPLVIVGLLIGLTIPTASAQRAKRRPGAAFEERYLMPLRREIVVDGAPRTALAFVPKTALNQPTPVLFAFHGHGGSMQNAARSFGFHQHWPEAIVVYPQGLATPSPADPNGRLPGWVTATSVADNRDLRFFDALLAELERDYKVDRSRIYATGHSNGGFFTYTLWASRPDVLAAVAPTACNLRRVDPGVKLSPKPVFYVGGEQDPLVSLESQLQAISRLREINACGEGAPGRRPNVTIYESPQQTPVVTLIHPGGHAFLEAASEPIVEFFKRHPQPRPAKDPG